MPFLHMKTANLFFYRLSNRCTNTILSQNTAKINPMRKLIALVRKSAVPTHLLSENDIIFPKVKLSEVHISLLFLSYLPYN